MCAYYEYRYLLWAAKCPYCMHTICIALFSLEADPNYKPVFSADESSSKSPIKTGMPIAKKFDSAHKKQFSRYIHVCVPTYIDLMANYLYLDS